MEDERNNVYLIPDNFIDESRVFNGMFKLRNFLEAILLSAPLALITSAVAKAAPINIRIMIVVGVALPLFLLCIIGIGGDSFLTYLSHLTSYRKNKKIMLYNDHIDNDYQKAELEKIDQPTARDNLIKKLRSLSHKDDEQVHPELIEGVTFEFVEDTLADKMTQAADKSGKKGRKSKVGKRIASEKTGEEGGFLLFMESDNAAEDLGIFSSNETFNKDVDEFDLELIE